ncbi:hypothetical protein AGMMS49975_16850 [Clostridia bacterium]|nr:hypothetical protein AGMMS49975_16850 [Clostridia bacterium]
MDNGKILSLCISIIWHKGEPRLFRIADIVDNELIPFKTDYSQRSGGTNTNIIFKWPKDIPVEGTISFWEWHMDDWRQLADIRHDLHWIEHVRLPKITSLEELQLALFNGIDLEFSSDHKCLLEFSNQGINQCVCCDSSDFKRKGDRWFLSDKTYWLDSYEIADCDIIEIKTPHLPNINRFYFRTCTQ